MGRSYIVFENSETKLTLPHVLWLSNNLDFVAQIVKRNQNRFKLSYDECQEIESLLIDKFIRKGNTFDNFEAYITLAVPHLIISFIKKHSRMNHYETKYEDWNKVDNSVPFGKGLTDNESRFDFLAVSDEDISLMEIEEFINSLPITHRRLLERRMNGELDGNVTQQLKSANYRIRQQLIKKFSETFGFGNGKTSRK